MGQYDKEFASGPMTDRSGTAGTSASVVCAANSSRRFFLFQNVSANDMWLNFDGVTAVADSPSIKIAAGLAFPFTGNFCPTGAVSVIASGASSKYSCKEA